MIRRRKPLQKHKGIATMFMAAFASVLITMSALIIDIGTYYASRISIQNYIDEAALSGVLVLMNESVSNDNKTAIALATAKDIFFKHKLFNTQLSEDNASFIAEFGYWDKEAKHFMTEKDGTEDSSALRLYAEYTNDYNFGKIFGTPSYTVSDEAIITFGTTPRDIAILIDLSASMNDDSALRNQYSGLYLSQTESEKHLILEHYCVLDEANISAFEDILSYSNLTGFNCNQTSFASNELVYYSSSTSNDDIINALGLDSVSYPGSGSWNSYVNYVKYSIYPYGYRNHYGYMTLINYWLDSQPSDTQTPMLDTAHSQPLQAVKDAVDIFLDQIEEMVADETNIDFDDKIGLAIFNYSSYSGKIEHSLTQDFEAIRTLTHTRQAGHYNSGTNIAAGINSAVDLLNSNCPDPVTSRAQAIILVSDGISSNSSAITAAQNAINCGIKIHTIAVGSDADIDLMEEIANLTGGIYFYIDDDSITEYTLLLGNTFGTLATGDDNYQFVI